MDANLVIPVGTIIDELLKEDPEDELDNASKITHSLVMLLDSFKTA